MTKKEFLQHLENELQTLQIPRRDEVLTDYKEHFENAIQQGQKEEDVCQNLGDPRVLAGAFEAERVLRPKANEPALSGARFWAVCFRLLVITPFNFLMLFGPFLATGILFIVGWTVTILLVALGLAGLILALILSPGFFINFWATGTFLFGSISFLSFSLVGLFVMWAISRMLIELFSKYLRWNVDFLLQKKVV